MIVLALVNKRRRRRRDKSDRCERERERQRAVSNKCSIIAAGVKSVASAIIYDTFGIFPCGFPGTRDKLAPARSNAYPASKIHARTETTGISSGWLVDNSTSTSTLRLKHPRSRRVRTPRLVLVSSFFPLSPLLPASCPHFCR